MLINMCYVYPKEKKIWFVQVYHKGSDFGVNHFHIPTDSAVLGITGAYKESALQSELVLARKDEKTKKTKIQKIFMNFVQGYIRCKNMVKEKRDNFIKDQYKLLVVKVQTVGFTFLAEFRFGLKPWKKFAKDTKKKEEKIPKSKKSLLMKIALWLFVILFVLLILVCVFLHFRKKNLKRKIDEESENNSYGGKEEPGLDEFGTDETEMNENHLDMSGL